MTATISVSHKGKSYVIQVDLTNTVSSFQAELEELTSVPIENQKLLFKGKKTLAKGHDTLLSFGLKDGIKVQMLGPTAADISGLRALEDEKKRTDQVLRDRETQARVRRATFASVVCQLTQYSQTYSPSTRSRASALNISYRFHHIQPLSHLPNPDSARSFLTRLASDEAILHVMNSHRFSVGLLTELAPHEHPGLLGLNVNQGESIKLRIRTDRYDGFRSYKEIRKVLCHELAHNLWSEHDDNVSISLGVTPPSLC